MRPVVTSCNDSVNVANQKLLRAVQKAHQKCHDEYHYDPGPGFEYKPSSLHKDMRLSNPVCFSTSLSNSGLIVNCSRVLLDQTPRKGMIVLVHTSESHLHPFHEHDAKAASAFEFQCPGVLQGAIASWPLLLAGGLEGGVRVLVQLAEDSFVQTAGHLLPLWTDRVL